LLRHLSFSFSPFFLFSLGIRNGGSALVGLIYNSQSSKESLHFEVVLRYSLQQKYEGDKENGKSNTKKITSEQAKVARSAFERLILNEGLYLEIEIREDEVFWKILAGFDRLCIQAEKEKLKFPLKVSFFIFF